MRSKFFDPRNVFHIVISNHNSRACRLNVLYQWSVRSSRLPSISWNHTHASALNKGILCKIRCASVSLCGMHNIGAVPWTCPTYQTLSFLFGRKPSTPFTFSFSSATILYCPLFSFLKHFDISILLPFRKP